MKVLIAGDWHSDIHEEQVDRALRALGHETERFAWNEYFKPRTTAPDLARALLKAQNKYLAGPQVTRLNRDFIARARHCQPDVVLVYRGTHLFPQTLAALRTAVPAAILVGYNNDDPCSPLYPRWQWRHFQASVACYDLILAYRTGNIRDFQRLGARRVELFRSWFVPGRHEPRTLTPAETRRFGSDVVFVGHYEDDGRLHYLEDIVGHGWKLRIFGPGKEWNRALARSRCLKDHQPVEPVWGDEYVKALCGAKAALCFLSRLNRDTYTRRCFEIPATGTLLLSEYSEDLTQLFIPGQEALLFRDRDELRCQLPEVIGNHAYRDALRQAGQQRVRRDGHDIVSRVKMLIAWLESLNSHARPPE